MTAQGPSTLPRAVATLADVDDASQRAAAVLDASRDYTLVLHVLQGSAQPHSNLAHGLDHWMARLHALLDGHGMPDGSGFAPAQQWARSVCEQVRVLRCWRRDHLQALCGPMLEPGGARHVGMAADAASRVDGSRVAAAS